MRSLTLKQKSIYKIIDLGHWWTRRQINIFRLGKEVKQNKLTTTATIALEKKGKVKVAKVGNAKIYATSGSVKHIEHGLLCTECLVKLAAADPDCDIIGENYFRKGRFGVVPEFGKLYPNGTALFTEVCTKDNATKSGLITRKIKAYGRYLESIEKELKAQAVVLFIIDLPEKEVFMKARQLLKGINYIYFCSYENFSNIPLGGHLVTPIYFMADGRLEGLRDV